MQLTITKKDNPGKLTVDESKLGFGRIFTDHMFTMEYNEESGWHNGQIRPFEPLSLSPATMVLHYGQAIFEGLKAYALDNGEIGLFRARDNYRRMNNSAVRLCIPPVDIDEVMDAMKQLIRIDKDWIPKSDGTSLYVRPTVIAADSFLGVHASHTYLFFIILSPVGAYYAEGLKPIKIMVEEKYTRAARGGLGFAKAAANYAASLKGAMEAEGKGYSQVLWLDAQAKKFVEEVGSMNIFFYIGDELVTPQVGADFSVLPGITRDSVLKLASEMGVKTVERDISIEEVMEAHSNGTLREAFGTGTAAVISAVGELFYRNENLIINGGKMGELSQKLYDTLTGIQTGKINDPYGWTERV